MITSGEGKYKVFLEKHILDDDLVYILGGGEKSHVGGVVVYEPYKNPEIMKFEGHYDYLVLQLIAEEACKKYNKKVVAVGGVHVHNASKEEIDILVNNCKELLKCI